ncbi:MAG: hypothetical protein VB778_06335 [Nitrospinaceae bacterium]|jgi:CheY-like chemotaxis protein
MDEARAMFSMCSILIVDDDPCVKGVIKHHLNRLGVKNVFEASDGD